ncbi:transcription initiation protein [Microlunatus elymi]|uniref:Transcription initiation protein n=1 Tax=Microlunatus elymi TaxID=2596828 RepID=A0A516Q423_9ACTN|nr:YciI family protein [Microlunatus elymi]QDP98154.1 transcription initiation protein [Microlunatus elymi]
MRYLLLISADESRIDDGEPSDEAIKVFTDWMDDLVRRGVLLSHEGLQPSRTATTVRVRDGHTLLTDGPYIEAKDQIGGMAIVEVDDLDAAIAIAAGHPACAWGQVEVRPIRQIASS